MFGSVSGISCDYKMSSSPDNTHHELSHEEKEKLSALFNRLDVNKDGSIDIHDLSAALCQMEVPQVPGQAQVETN